MPKKIIFESAVYHFLTAVRHRIDFEKRISDQNHQQWLKFTESLDFDSSANNGEAYLKVKWAYPKVQDYQIDLKEPQFYSRKDGKSQTLSSKDPAQQLNADFFAAQIKHIAGIAGLPVSGDEGPAEVMGDSKPSEEVFHDAWAKSATVDNLSVKEFAEACTVPELKYIREKLGDLKGKTLLELGSGLGEAAVYFAVEGADVMAVDISPEMLNFSSRLAAKHNVSIKTHQSQIEFIDLPENQKFDIVYCGNLLHHVDINVTLMNIRKYMKPNGIFVSWDPVAYNPVINVYRKMAKDTRTPDEHPLTLHDIKLFKRYFSNVEVRWFWLFTLIIFVLMYLVERRNPNKERFWKQVVVEADKWAWLYKPLEKLDNFVLKVFPFLGPLCWNVAVVASNPKNSSSASVNAS